MHMDHIISIKKFMHIALEILYRMMINVFQLIKRKSTGWPQSHSNISKNYYKKNYCSAIVCSLVSWQKKMTALEACTLLFPPGATAPLHPFLRNANPLIISIK